VRDVRRHVSVELPPIPGVKGAGPRAGPFQGRQATEVDFAGASEASSGPCGELLRFCVQDFKLRDRVWCVGLSVYD